MFTSFSIRTIFSILTVSTAFAFSGVAVAETKTPSQSGVINFVGNVYNSEAIDANAMISQNVRELNEQGRMTQAQSFLASQNDRDLYSFSYVELDESKSVLVFTYN